jgi:peptidoglycan/LPS O-acetylase OafA/YrhL
MASGSVREEIGHLAPVDGLRGLAVTGVVLFHLLVLRRETSDPWIGAVVGHSMLEPIAGAGFLGVDLFFLISGFLLAMPWFVHARQGKPRPSIREFYRRRVMRIVPAYYVHLVLLFAIVLPLALGAAYWKRDLYVYAFNAVMHGLFLHNTTPLTSGSMGVNGALWTLAVEAQFYLILPLVALVSVRAPLATLVVSIVVAILWRIGSAVDLAPLVALELWIGTPWQWPEEVVRRLLLYQLPSYLGHFALGIFMGGAWLRWRDGERSPVQRYALHATLLGALGMLYWVIAVNGLLWGRQTWLVHTLALGIVLFWSVASGSPIAQSVLGRGPLAFIGRISYSMYLYHLPLLLLFNKYAAAGWLSVPLYLAVLAAVAWLSWRYVEQPYLRR